MSNEPGSESTTLPSVDTQDLPPSRFVRRSLATSLRKAAAASSVFVLALVVWQVVIVVFQPQSYLLPSPASVWAEMINPALDWPSHIWVTGQEALGGFGMGAAVGIILGGLIASTPFLSQSLLPFLVVFNTVPKVATAPLFLLYLGFGIVPNMVIAATIAFFPVVITTAVGLAQIDPDLVDLGRSLRAPRWKIFVRIRIPNAMPYVMGGLKVSSTMAVTGAIVGEFVASQEGLGNLMIQTLVNLDTALAFAALAYLSCLGLAFYGTITLAGWAFMPWARDRPANP